MQGLSTASQFGTSWGGRGGVQGCGSCPLGGLVTLESALCHLCRMWQRDFDGIPEMAAPSLASS